MDRAVNLWFCLVCSFSLIWANAYAFPSDVPDPTDPLQSHQSSSDFSPSIDVGVLEIFSTSSNETEVICGNLNLAANQASRSSSALNSTSESNRANDGDLSTSWESDGSGLQWLDIDLGGQVEICRVVIHWEAAFAEQFQIQFSNQGEIWNTLTNIVGNTGLDNEFDVSGSGRWLRIFMQRSSINCGYGIREVEVFGTEEGYLNRPPLIEDTQFNLAENSPAGMIVDTMMAQDIDGNQLNFSIVGGNPLDAFSIDPSTGIIKVNNAAAIDYEVFPRFELTVKVSDNGPGNLSSTATVNVDLIDLDDSACPSENIAIGKLALASSEANANTRATFATDNRFFTRWQSAGNGEEWIYVNLEENYDICAIELNWSTYAIDYKVQVRTDISSWQDVSTVTGNTSISNQLTDLNATGSFVRILATRSVSSSYSLSEFKIFGKPAAINHAPTMPAQSFSISEKSEAGDLVGFLTAEDVNGDAFSFTILDGNEGQAFALDAETGALTVNNAFALDFEKQSEFKLLVKVTDDGIAQLSSANTVLIRLNDVQEGFCGKTQLTLNKPITASSFRSSSFAPQNAVDGLFFTSWFSSTNGVEWLSIDLESVVDICRVRVFWGNPALRYLVQVSNDGQSWSTLFSEKSNSSRTTDLSGLAGRGRYVRIVCTKALSTTGYSIRAIEAYGITQASNQAPKANSAAFTIEENSINGTEVGQVAANDPNQDSLLFAIVSGNINNAFAIDPQTGVITVNNTNALDAETSPKFKLQVTATEYTADQFSSTAFVSISILDIDEEFCTAENIALDQLTTASSNANLFLTSNLATDGDPNTRWASSSQEGVNDWLLIDLGEVYDICGMEILWHGQYASSYRVQESEDKLEWEDVQIISNNQSVRNVLRGLDASSQFLRIWVEDPKHCAVSISEVSVFATEEDEDTDSFSRKRATASLQGEPKVSIFPNPVQSILTFEIVSNESDKLHITLSDIMGKVHKQEQVHIERGTEQYFWDVQSLPSGYYFIKVKGNQSDQVTKILITH